MVKYANFFINDTEFLAWMVNKFLSEYAILSQDRKISNPSTYQFTRLTEILIRYPSFKFLADDIIKKITQIID